VTDEEIAAIEARAAAATVGEWRDMPAHWGQADVVVHDPDGHTLINGEPHTKITDYIKRSDAAFIAAARTDVPALLAEVRRLRAIGGLESCNRARRAAEEECDRLKAALAARDCVYCRGTSVTCIICGR
jgi:hypothetical protein